MEKKACIKYSILPFNIAPLACVVFLLVTVCQGVIPAIETAVLAEFIDSLNTTKRDVIFLVVIYIALFVCEWFLPTIKKQAEIPIQNKLRVYSNKIFFDKKINLNTPQ